MKISEARKLAKAAPKYVLFIDGAGFLSDSQGLTGVNFTQDESEARKFSVGFDSEEMKTGIWNAAAKRMFNNPSVTFEVKYL
jgi:hypothetical protein